VEFADEDIVLRGAVEQSDIAELVVEEGVDGLHVVGDSAEKRRFWHMFLYLAYSDHLGSFFFGLLLSLRVFLLAFYLRS